MSSAQMRHPNLVLLLGACVQKVGKWAMITGILLVDSLEKIWNSCLIILEYMSRGSLEDILHKSDAKINFSKKIQFAIDICNGMAWISGRDVRIN